MLSGRVRVGSLAPGRGDWLRRRRPTIALRGQVDDDGPMTPPTTPPTPPTPRRRRATSGAAAGPKEGAADVDVVADAPSPAPRRRRASATKATTAAEPRGRTPHQRQENDSSGGGGGDDKEGRRDEGVVLVEGGAAARALSPPSRPSPPLPRVLIIHTGGTLGMDVEAAYEAPSAAAAAAAGAAFSAASPPTLRRGAAAASYPAALRPGTMLSSLLSAVPELRRLARPTLHVALNTDSSAIGPREWQLLARLMHDNRAAFDGFIVIHGTDTLAYTASALSLMLVGFGKPVVLTGSQLPLASPRSDARQNLIDALTCITAAVASGGGGQGRTKGSRPPLLQEVAICFGGRLLRGNRATKTHSAHYAAFDSPSHPPLAVLGVDVEWNEAALLAPTVKGANTAYRPRFRLESSVVRMPVVPGLDPRLAYGQGAEVAARGVRGVVLEAFGVGNLPDGPDGGRGWRPFLEQLTGAGVLVCLISQCARGPLRPDAYAAGVAALALEGLGTGPHTAEAALAKTMLCCAYKELALGVPLAGEI